MERVEDELLGSMADATRLPGSLPAAWKRAASGTLVIEGVEQLSIEQQTRLAELARAELGGRPHVICTTSSNVDEAVDKGKLSRSLRETFGAVHLNLPPLRDRGEDVAWLAVHIVGRQCERLHRDRLTLSREALTELCVHDWPENVAELEKDLEAAVEACANGGVLGAGILGANAEPPVIAKVVKNIIGGRDGLDRSMAQLEAAVISEALERHHGNRSAAARLLKLPRQTLQDRMKKHGLWPS
jgi:DNA-binding NtrC family response regulator